MPSGCQTALPVPKEKMMTKLDQIIKRREEITTEMDKLAADMVAMENRRTALLKEGRELHLQERNERDKMLRTRNPPSGVHK
jgi:hypothetical protein